MATDAETLRVIIDQISACGRRLKRGAAARSRESASSQSARCFPCAAITTHSPNHTHSCIPATTLHTASAHARWSLDHTKYHTPYTIHYSKYQLPVRTLLVPTVYTLDDIVNTACARSSLRPCFSCSQVKHILTWGMLLSVFCFVFFTH